MSVQTAGGGFLARCDTCGREWWATMRSAVERLAGEHTCRGEK